MPCFVRHDSGRVASRYNRLMIPVLFPLLLAFSQNAAVPVESEPHHHLVLQNQFTRVYQVEIPPHQSTLLHHHVHDYIGITLGAAEIQNAVEGKLATTAKLADGQTNFSAGNFSHVITDVGATPFRNVTIEILTKPAKNAAPPERGLDIGHGGLSDTVIDNASVRVADTQIAAGGMLHKHQHAYPHLIVAITDLQLHDMAAGKPAVMRRQKAGEVRWVPAGVTHEVMNMGQQAARFIVVEFK